MKAEAQERMLLVSACLAGMSTRFDGSNCQDETVKRLVAEGKAIPVCCEQLGGLTTPRDPDEIQNGTGEDVLEGRARVVTRRGNDTTGAFLRGAREVLSLARLVKAREAILKAGSPSCGCGWIYDGTFTETRREGAGVTAALLKRNGISVRTEEGLREERGRRE